MYEPAQITDTLNFLFYLTITQDGGRAQGRFHKFCPETGSEQAGSLTREPACPEIVFLFLLRQAAPLHASFFCLRISSARTPRAPAPRCGPGSFPRSRNSQ